MNVDEMITGQFWLPESPQQTSIGIIIGDEGAGFTLTLFQAIYDADAIEKLNTSDGDKPDDIETIYGLDDSGRKITLHNLLCLTPLSAHVLRSVISPPKDVSRREYIVGALIEGAHIPNGTDHDANEPPPLFSELEIRSEVISSYFGGGKFSSDRTNQNASVSVTAQLDPEETWELPDGLQLSLIPILQESGGRTKPRILQFSPRLSLKVSPDESPLPLYSLLEIGSYIHDFITLLAEQEAPVELVVLRAKEGSTLVKDEIRRRTHLNSRTEQRPGPFKQEQTSPYEAIKADFRTYLANWLSMREKITPIYNRVAAARSDRATYAETKFMLLVQAAEGLHRQFMNEEPQLSGNELKTLKNAAREVITKENREWLDGKLAFINHMTLRARLDFLLKGWNGTFGNDDERAERAKRIVSLRNGDAHVKAIQSTSSPKEAGQELLQLTFYLDALLQLHLRVVIGMQKEFLAQSLQSPSNHLKRSKLDFALNGPPTKSGIKVVKANPKK